MRASHNTRRASHGVVSAFVFNLCIFLLPLAAAAAVLVIGRDHLYAYEFSPAGARVISQRVERLNGRLIQLDFDRLQQWNDLVLMELNANDIPAARGFLLSGPGMLPERMGNALDRIASDGDATVELAAVDLLTPSTRALYEQRVPLLSQREGARTAAPFQPVGDEQDFELMARALLSEPDGDSFQFILTGLSLGLAGDFGQRGRAGAAALLAASRREDYPEALRGEVGRMMSQAVSMDEFRRAALASGDAETAGAYANSSVAFRAAVNRAGADRVRGLLDEIGAMGQQIGRAHV